MPKLKNLFVSETCLRLCAIDLRISFLALAIASKKTQNCQWNLLKVVAIWRSQWNFGFSKPFCIDVFTFLHLLIVSLISLCLQFFLSVLVYLFHISFFLFVVSSWHLSQSIPNSRGTPRGRLKLKHKNIFHF